MMKRTHTCGGLRQTDIGSTATLIGWVHARRDHGKLIFIDIRDREGLTQVVFIPNKKTDLLDRAQLLRSEFLISVHGDVNERPKGTSNEKIPTGYVEILAHEMEIINESKTPPFDIVDDCMASEEVRLQYRPLDLRRPCMLANLKLRHKVGMIIRAFLDAQGFIEVETPILTKSTPEGARDYLVPSRLNRGSFYALPQSPQLFKQLLMVAGFEKYFQIARCFRDEDLRADRQPEFTQLDLEMSFVDEEDIFALIEALMKEIFMQAIGYEVVTPFKRLTYAESMAQYGTDKPDTRTEGEAFNFVWVTDFPLFAVDEATKTLHPMHHPFTALHETDIPLLETDLEKIRSRAYDLVINGIEIGSGSVRIHQRELQEKVFAAIGLAPEEAQARFGFLLKAFDYAAPPHAGFAPGLDRLIALMAQTENIREVIAFPKTQSATCPLTEAPGEVDQAQLDDLGVHVTRKQTPSETVSS